MLFILDTINESMSKQDQSSKDSSPSQGTTGKSIAFMAETMFMIIYVYSCQKEHITYSDF